MAKTNPEPHGRKYPIVWLAKELGVDRGYLSRRLGAGTFTIAEAFEALTARLEREEDRARQQKADADAAEINAAEKRGLLMLKSDARLLWADATIEVRKVIESQEQWEAKKLLLALSKIKPADPDED